MIISRSNIGMNSSSSNMQVKTYEAITRNLSNSSISSVFTAETVSMQLQNSSSRQVNNLNPKANTVDYRNPAYKKSTNNSIHDDRENDEKKGRDKVNISDDAKQMSKKASVSKVKSVSSDYRPSKLVLMDFKYSLLDSIVRLLTGGKSNLLKLNPLLDSDFEKFKDLKRNIEDSFKGKKPEKIAPENGNVKLNLVPAQQVQFVFQRVDEKTTFYEEQNMNFHAAGSVTTADGREISLEVNLSMSSQFYSSNETSVVQAMKDPLVMNFGPEPVELTQTKYDFDIDCDGKSDQISFVAGNSGFLVHDKNGDGTVNDGSELFGARTGDGFAELAAFDKDSNGWIDEADDIFNKLRVWMKDEAGNDRLLSLGEAGIGALYLGNVDTDFNLRGDTGDLNGQIRKTGVYLNENGTAGTMHHVDLAV